MFVTLGKNRINQLLAGFSPLSKPSWFKGLLNKFRESIHFRSFLPLVNPGD
jgi:hypothetical protein